MSATERDRVASIEEERERREPYMNWFCLCLACKYRWIGTVMFKTSVFKLECSKCGAFDSFATPVPEELLEQYRE